MRATLDACLAQLDGAVLSFPWRNRAAYADWLAQTYFHVRHSTRLLAASAARFPHDDAGNALHQRFSAHIGEEKSHELLAAHDIKALGLKLEDFPERYATRMFYEPQYYKIEHQDPCALFGYILQLEGITVSRGKWVLAHLDEAYGRSAGTFMRVHAEEDVDHLDRAIASLTGASERQRAFIEDNLCQSTAAYVALLSEMHRAHEGARDSRAA